METTDAPKVSPETESLFADLDRQAGNDPQIKREQQETQQQRANWNGAAEFAVNLLANQAPNWTITEKQKSEASGAIAQILADWFPGGVGNLEEWGPFTKLAFVTGTVLFANYDWHLGGLKPLRQEPEPKQETNRDERRAADSNNRREPQRQNRDNRARNKGELAIVSVGPEREVGDRRALSESDFTPGTGEPDKKPH